MAKLLVCGILIVTAMVHQICAVTWETRMEKFNAADVNSAIISIVTGDITIQSTDSSQILVQFANGLEKPSEIETDVAVRDGVLRISERTLVNSPKGSTSWIVSFPQDKHVQVLKCTSSLGDIQIAEIRSDSLTAHAATGKLSVENCKSVTAKLSTSSGRLDLTNTIVTEVLNCVSSGGEVTVDVPQIPAGVTEAASTSGRVFLKVPEIGDNISLTLLKNEGVGSFKVPFECDKSWTRKEHPADTYRVDGCELKRGAGSKHVTLTTGTGQIVVKEKQKR